MDKVWTFIIGSKLHAEELQALSSAGKKFVSGWTAHERPLEASFEIRENAIVIVSVSEKVYEASGCSIDKLMRFMREQEQLLNVQLLNRLLVAYRRNDTIQVIPSSDVPVLLKEGILTPDSIVYNTAVSNSLELSNWEIPLRQSWLKKFLAA